MRSPWFLCKEATVRVAEEGVDIVCARPLHSLTGRQNFPVVFPSHEDAGAGREVRHQQSGCPSRAALARISARRSSGRRGAFVRVMRLPSSSPIRRTLSASQRSADARTISCGALPGGVTTGRRRARTSARRTRSPTSIPHPERYGGHDKKKNHDTYADHVEGRLISVGCLAHSASSGGR